MRQFDARENLRAAIDDVDQLKKARSQIQRMPTSVREELLVILTRAEEAAEPRLARAVVEYAIAFETTESARVTLLEAAKSAARFERDDQGSPWCTVCDRTMFDCDVDPKNHQFGPEGPCAGSRLRNALRGLGEMAPGPLPGIARLVKWRAHLSDYTGADLVDLVQHALDAEEADDDPRMPVEMRDALSDLRGMSQYDQRRVIAGILHEDARAEDG
jgi:hypothetical protein